MKPSVFLLFFLCIAVFGFTQTPEYQLLVKKADSLYNAHQYKASGITYSEAFKINQWKGVPIDRYNAACSWAMADNLDSAFFQLNLIAVGAGFSDYEHIIKDYDLSSLRTDARWQPLLEIIKRNQEKEDAKLNKSLIIILDSIYKDDQLYRLKINEIEKNYGLESKEMKTLWATIGLKDSINLIKTKAILDKYGWLGKDIIGEKGNTTLFLIIQHADLTTQTKYLPMMREAVTHGNAAAANLALLEDRVAIRQGKKQIYGSQIARDPDTKEYYVSPLDDPDNVDTRRANVGLNTMAEYVQYWQMKWDPESYKKELPKIIARETKMRNPVKAKKS